MLDSKRDSLGFDIPILKARSMIQDEERLYVRTTFKYRLVRLPYSIEVCLFHNLAADSKPICTVNLVAANWDDVVGSRGMNVSSLFPDKMVEGYGVRFFLELMEKLSQFVSDALPVLD